MLDPSRGSAEKFRVVVISNWLELSVHLLHLVRNRMRQKRHRELRPVPRGEEGGVESRVADASTGEVDLRQAIEVHALSRIGGFYWSLGRNRLLPNQPTFLRTGNRKPDHKAQAAHGRLIAHP